MEENITLGKCNCGDIEFELTGQAKGVFLCHCSICRRLTGSNGIAVVLIGKKDFRWTRGEDRISRWTKPGHDWKSCFCSVCGSTLPVDNDESNMAIPPGLLSDGGQTFRVIHHLWVDSKANWDDIGDAGQQHSKGYKQ